MVKKFLLYLHSLSKKFLKFCFIRLCYLAVGVIVLIALTIIVGPGSQDSTRNLAMIMRGLARCH